MEGYIGEIRLFAGNFAPRGWAFCDGSLQSIAVYTAAYSIIGTTYGGDGQTTFALPDFRGRSAVGTGQGLGLSNIELGQIAGVESVTMTTAQMPAHTHIATAVTTMQAYSSTDTNGSPDGAVLAALTQAYSTQSPDSTLKPVTGAITLSVAGSGIPFSVIQPVNALNYIVCLEGIYPSRN